LKNPALKNLRAWPVQGFEDMRLFYATEGKILRIIRVLHAKRDIKRILEDETGDMLH
jgi:plasmid stabilization system protein ParE